MGKIIGVKNGEVAMPGCSSVVNSSDINYILGQSQTHTWDEFYEIMELERAEGKERCPQASMIALELLRSSILKTNWRSNRTTSDTHNDLIQNAYLVIADHIADFDRSQSSFKTYISKWIQGLARETRDDGISNYQKKQMGVKVVSTDALVAKEDGSTAIEFVDEHSSVEDIIEKKEKMRSNEMFGKVLGRDCETIESSLAEDEKIRKNIYANAACYNLFLGGMGNLPDGMDEALEELVSND